MKRGKRSRPDTTRSVKTRQLMSWPRLPHHAATWFIPHPRRSGELGKILTHPVFDINTPCVGFSLLRKHLSKSCRANHFIRIDRGVAYSSAVGRFFSTVRCAAPVIHVPQGSRTCLIDRTIPDSRQGKREFKSRRGGGGRKSRDRHRDRHRDKHRDRHRHRVRDRSGDMHGGEERTKSAQRTKKGQGLQAK